MFSAQIPCFLTPCANHGQPMENAMFGVWGWDFVVFLKLLQLCLQTEPWHETLKIIIGYAWLCNVACALSMFPVCAKPTKQIANTSVFADQLQQKTCIHNFLEHQVQTVAEHSVLSLCFYKSSLAKLRGWLSSSGFQSSNIICSNDFLDFQTSGVLSQYRSLYPRLCCCMLLLHSPPSKVFVKGGNSSPGAVATVATCVLFQSMAKHHKIFTRCFCMLLISFSFRLLHFRTSLDCRQAILNLKVVRLCPWRNLLEVCLFHLVSSCFAVWQRWCGPRGPQWAERSTKPRGNAVLCGHYALFIPTKHFNSLAARCSSFLQRRSSYTSVTCFAGHDSGLPTDAHSAQHNLRVAEGPDAWRFYLKQSFKQS